MKAELDGLLNRLGEVVKDQPLKWPVSVATLVTSVAFTVGLVTTTSALALWAGIALIVTLFLSLVIVTLSRRGLLLQMGARQNVLDWYANKLFERQRGNPTIFSIENWIEDVVVHRNGKASITRRFDLLVGTDPLDAFWNVTFPTHSSAVTDKIREKVSVSANLVNGGQLGTSMDITMVWPEPHKLRTIVHLGQDVAAGSRIVVELQWEWPGFYKAFLGGRREINDWTLRRDTKQLEAKFTISRGLAPNGLRVTELPGCVAPTESRQRNGSITLTYVAKNVAPESRLGYVVELIR